MAVQVLTIILVAPHPGVITSAETTVGAEQSAVAVAVPNAASLVSSPQSTVVLDGQNVKVGPSLLTTVKVCIHSAEFPPASFMK